MERWSGRVALVTGASSGFGAVIAKRLVEHGMKVVGCARNIESIQSLARTVEGAEGSLLAIQCDVSKEDQILSMFDEIKSKYGGLDVVINNAGVAHNAPLLTGNTEHWRNMFDVNVLGSLICTREAVKSMKERSVDDGHVFLINSVLGHRVYNVPVFHFYAASKFAITALTEGLRNELVQMKSHIRVTAVSPGAGDTQFFKRVFKNEPEIATAIQHRFENLQADDIADAIVYALSAPPRAQVHDILIHPTEWGYRSCD